METTYSSSTKKKNKMSNKNHRRFSDEQIKLLESMFESESKLEPRKKIQLARDLELQPRQVAIWFQNRRARWKSKQIEKEFKVLRANYDHLAFQFESLKKEKQSLLIQLEKLNEQFDKPRDGSDYGDTKCNSDAKPSFLQEGYDKSVNNGSYGDERREGEDCSSEKWCNFDPLGVYDHSYGNSQWCNFWT